MKSKEIRKNLYDYLSSIGLTLTDERHNIIHDYLFDHAETKLAEMKERIVKLEATLAEKNELIKKLNSHSPKSPAKKIYNPKETYRGKITTWFPPGQNPHRT